MLHVTQIIPIGLRRPRRSWALLALALALGSAPLGAQTPPAQVIVIRAGRMIDGTGAAPVHPAMVRIEGDRIAESEPACRFRTAHA